MPTELLERPQGLLDGSPYLPRNVDNPISLAESVRDEIYKRLTELCEDVGVNAMLAKSSPYSAEVWVRIEIRRRADEPGQVTGRSWATFTITPKPFHRLPQEFTLEYQMCGRLRIHRPLGPVRRPPQARRATRSARRCRGIRAPVPPRGCP